MSNRVLTRANVPLLGCRLAAATSGWLPLCLLVMSLLAMRNRLIGAVAAAIAVALLASSCAATGTSSGSSELVGASTQENRALILQLERPQLDGAVFDPNTVANKDVLLWFWAPW